MNPILDAPWIMMNRNNNIHFEESQYACNLCCKGKCQELQRNYFPTFWSPLTSVQQDSLSFAISSDPLSVLKLHHILFSLQSSLCHLCVRAVILIFPGLVYTYEQYLHELLYLRTLWHLCMNVFMHTSKCVSRWSQNIPLLPIYPSFHCCIIDEEAVHSSFAF